MPAQWPRMVLAELRKIFTRGSGQAGLIVALLVGVVPVLVLLALQDGRASVDTNGQSAQSLISYEVATALGWALRARNFFILPLILLMVIAQLLAGEWAERNLRALLLRPVPRWSVLAAKLAAAQLYAALTLVITYIAAMAVAAPFLGWTDPITRVSLGYLASGLSDLGLLSIGLFVSTIYPSVPGVIVGTVLLLVADLAARGGMKVAGAFGATWADPIAAWLPGTALAAWEGHSSAWDPRAFASLVALIALFSLAAGLRFQKSDVP